MLLLASPECANKFTFRLFADRLYLWDRKSFALLNLLLDAFKFVILSVNNLE